MARSSSAVVSLGNVVIGFESRYLGPGMFFFEKPEDARGSRKPKSGFRLVLVHQESRDQWLVAIANNA